MRLVYCAMRVHVKEPQIVGIGPEPSTTTLFLANVLPLDVEPPYTLPEEEHNFLSQPRTLPCLGRVRQEKNTYRYNNLNLNSILVILRNNMDIKGKQVLSQAASYEENDGNLLLQLPI